VKVCRNLLTANTGKATHMLCAQKVSARSQLQPQALTLFNQMIGLDAI
jgi:hypothetical protein